MAAAAVPRLEFVPSSFVGKSGALFLRVRIRRAPEPPTNKKSEGTGTR
jgi:hypothetical protein